MKIAFTKSAWEEYLYWQKSDARVLKRINLLIKETLRTPTEGIGKPEALRQNLKGYWSRRITDEHRMVYKVGDDVLFITQLRYHY